MSTYNENLQANNAALAEILAMAEALPDAGTGGITEETDPTVPDWAKQPNKPTYTAAEVGAIPAPATASVGQTIKVSAVDDSGKPTAWEAVDFPEGGGIVEIASGVDVSAVSSFSYSEDINGNKLKTNRFSIILTAPNLSAKVDAWIHLKINGVEVLKMYYYQNKRINLRTIIHPTYVEHTLYLSEHNTGNGNYIGSQVTNFGVLRFVRPIDEDLTNSEKTIQLLYNYGINDPAWGDGATLWMWGE